MKLTPPDLSTTPQRGLRIYRSPRGRASGQRRGRGDAAADAHEVLGAGPIDASCEGVHALSQVRDDIEGRIDETHEAGALEPQAVVETRT